MKKMFSHHKNFTMMQGKSNYPCHLLSATAEKCIMKKGMGSLTNSICKTCEYRQAKFDMNAKPHLITNYTFWLISQLYGEYIEPRDITIYDECHVLNNVFSSNLEIIINDKVIESITTKLKSFPVSFNFVDSQNKLLIELQSSIKKDLDIKVFLQRYLNILTDVLFKYDEEAKLQYESGDTESYKKLKTICSYLENRVSTLQCYFNFDYKKTEVVDWLKKEIRVKPIYINELSKKY